MSGALDFAAGRFKVIKDGRVAFDTQTPAARLAPSKKLTLTDYSIEFPDLWKGIFYSTVYTTIPIGEGFPPIQSNRASSYIGLIGQEWGPDQPSDYNLPDIVLGSAPAGANYLNVMVNLTNTVAPGKIDGDEPMMSWLPAGKWTRLAGASCLIEGHGPLRRSIDILIEDGDIILRRYQSVNDHQGVLGRQSVGYSHSLGSHFYYHPGIPGTNAGYASGHTVSIGQWLDNTDNWGDDSINPDGSHHASLDTTTVSYRSVWKGSLEITPGRVG